ncbi:hypothetical protein [Winogradskyella flava]|uniref:hypothetical protein n=1 Tax=Winogradskyella flava TaxID=1884876 RepID=UPI0024928573|nr:hypothetical protein [Winogradskyella flava]
MKLKLTILLLTIFCASCKQKEILIEPKVVNVVGELFSDELLDSNDFKLCISQERIVQYYGLGEKTYKGEKQAIIDVFKSLYQPIDANRDSGWVRIRFVVNCEGISGRFRVLEMDNKYKTKKFDSHIIKQLLEITKKLDGWKAMKMRGYAVDYYQYLLFKIENGKLIEIMP